VQGRKAGVRLVGVQRRGDKQQRQQGEASEHLATFGSPRRARNG
jgi:hypothetical protein